MATVAACSLGWLVSDRTFRGVDFAVNVLASLALLGPGFLITNVLARNWRTRRDGEWVRANIAGPVDTLLLSITGDLWAAVRDLAAVVPTFDGSRQKVVDDKGADPYERLQALWYLLNDMCDTVDAICRERDEEKARQLEKLGWYPSVWAPDILRQAIGDMSRFIPVGRAEADFVNLKEASDALDAFGSRDRDENANSDPFRYVYTVNRVTMSLVELIDSLMREMPPLSLRVPRS